MIKRASTFLAIVLVCVMTFALECSSGEKADVQYEVTISVVYNAVSPAEAERIAGVAMREHSGACKADVKMKKVDSGGLIFSSSGDTITFTEAISVWDGSLYHCDNMRCSTSTFRSEDGKCPSCGKRGRKVD